MRGERSFRIRSAAAVALGLAVVGGAPCRAETRPRFELTAQAGYRIGGELADAAAAGVEHELGESSSRRLTLNIAAQAGTQWEVLWGRQETTLETDAAFGGSPLVDLDIDYVHFGGTYLFDDGGDYYPFIVLTAGLARFEPRRSDLDAENFLSASIGGGVQLRANKRVGVRLEGRAFASLIDSDGGAFCRSGPGGAFCAVTVEGDAVFQFEAGVGVVYRF